MIKNVSTQGWLNADSRSESRQILIDVLWAAYSETTVLHGV